VTVDSNAESNAEPIMTSTIKAGSNRSLASSLGRACRNQEAMPPARRPGWQSIPLPVVPGFLPGDPGGDPPGGARVQIALLEVNAPVAA
jgi:hypothetical protein